MQEGYFHEIHGLKYHGGSGGVSLLCRVWFKRLAGKLLKEVIDSNCC